MGVGVLQQENTLLILTSATMMKVQVDAEKIDNFDPEYGFNCCTCIQISSCDLLQHWANQSHQDHHDTGHFVWVQC
jgi:hypothetical protein